jgi:hypothetical protein
MIKPVVAGGRWTERILYSFDPYGTDGILPYAGLVLDASGNLYDDLGRRLLQRNRVRADKADHKWRQLDGADS